MTENSRSSVVSTLSCLRWVWFGVVVYASLFVILKRNGKSVSHIGDLYRGCRPPEMIREICSCNLTLPSVTSGPATSVTRRQTPSNEALNNGQSWRQRSKEVLLKRVGNRNVQISQRKTVELDPRAKHHVAFVKTHKAASSTVLNILYRYARERDLVVLLPKDGNYLHGRYLNKTSLLPPPKGRTYDILCNHAIFNHTSFSQFLPRDTIYIGIVREPFARIMSAFYYFRYVHTKNYLKTVPGHFHRSFRTYVENPSRWEPQNPMNSMTNNRMSIDFGYPPEQFHNESRFQEYLVKLNKIFRVVIVAERFDESLVLMKRSLNWNITDIVYIIKNRGRMKQNQRPGMEKLKPNLKRYSNLDEKLYTFFVDRLNKEIEKEGPMFKEEVAYFRRVKGDIEKFCIYNHHHREINIPRSNWTAAFSFTKRQCRYIRLEELEFLYFVRSQQKADLQGWGANSEFMKSLP